MQRISFFIGILISLIVQGVLTAQVPCATPQISGTLTYDNAASTPLSYSMVYLKSPSGVALDSCTVDPSGHYGFCQVVNGTYTLTARTLMPWGGVNATDAQLVMQHFAQLLIIGGLGFTAANVKSGTFLNAIDALLIAKRYTQMIYSFEMNDWIFSEETLVVIDSTNQLIHLKARCTGDVDSSLIPVMPLFECGDTLIDWRDLQEYPTVQIGNQCWMAKNLNIGKKVTDHLVVEPHSHCSDNDIIEKYCYNNNTQNCNVYGGLYDWNEMMQYDTTPGIQGICPDGWHIPTNDEWCEMTTFLDPSVNCDTIGFTGTNAGGMLKETGTIHWKSPNTGATNSTGFTSIGTGNRSMNGGYAFIRTYRMMWSSTSNINGNTVSTWGQAYNSTLIAQGGPSPDASYKLLGVSIRCIKTEE